MTTEGGGWTVSNFFSVTFEKKIHVSLSNLFLKLSLYSVGGRNHRNFFFNVPKDKCLQIFNQLITCQLDNSAYH